MVAENTPNGRTCINPKCPSCIKEYIAKQWPKRCGCGRAYVSLKHYQDHTEWFCFYKDEFGRQEWRHCTCGSTLAAFIEVFDLSKE